MTPNARQPYEYIIMPWLELMSKKL